MEKGKWDILTKGNLDIYYAFILKCLDLLTDDGVMVSITPNSYLYNKSSQKLREYLVKNRHIERIIDFKSEKVFPNVSTYCCITIYNKKEKESFIYNDKTINYFQKLSIFIAVSTRESFGVSILEAGSCEVPAITSDVGGLPEVNLDKKTGFVIGPKDPEILAQKIIYLYKMIIINFYINDLSSILRN